MRKLIYTILTAGLIFLLSNADAQMTIPSPSPGAMVKQTVGLTDITIEYNSPGVKGREGNIWGGLVPYNEVWRMGANSSTKITFSRDVNINGETMEAGTYSLGAIPNEDQWTLIFSNTEELGGWGNYNPDNDALRINVEPKESDFDERMRFSIVDFDNREATVKMDWENLQVSFDLEVATDEQAWSSIESTLNPDWRTYAQAARYAMNERKDYDIAMEWINRSIEMDENWYNSWFKAQIYAGQNNNNQALRTAQKAMDLGLQAEEAGEYFFFKGAIENAINEWSDR